jgi:hypothetical protein
MSYSASHNGEYERESVPQTARQVLRDVIELAELQLHLLRCDVKHCTTRVIGPAALLFGASAVLLLAAIPVALVAISLGIMEAGLPGWLAFAIVAAVTSVVAALLAVWAWDRCRAISTEFRRSRDELDNNIACLKRAAEAGREAIREPIS